MALTPAKKILTLCAFSGLLSAAAIAVVGHGLLDTELTSQARQQASNSAALLGSRVGDELRSIAERARFYASAVNSDKGASDRALAALAGDDRFIAISLLKRQPTETTVDWVASYRWARPLSDPLHFDENDFQEIELKHPLDLDQVGEGFTELVFGNARNQASILRLAIPFGEKGTQSYERVLVAELSQHWLFALFSQNRSQFSFLVNPEGHLVSASEPGHFSPGDDLSAIEAVRTATTSASPAGALDYSETPNGPTQHAAYFRATLGTASSSTHLTVVTQISRFSITQVLDSYIQTSAFAAFGFALFSGLLAMLIGQTSLSGLSTGVMTEDPEWRESEQGTVIKFRSPELKARFEKEQIRFKGERKSAMVLHVHLNGIDRASKAADPEKFLTLLNRFNDAVTAIVESHGGFVDHAHGGSIIGCWGIPFSLDHDADRALKAALEVRAAAFQFNSELEKLSLPPTSLGMGMHYGSVIAGRVGSPGRMEYSAIGDAIETSSRIPGYTDQFGTDLLITGAAVAQLSAKFPTERVATGDDMTPELYELIQEEAAAA